MRILVAEDTELNRDLLVQLLENRGHAVVCVGDGVEALTMLARQTFDIVLMDEVMPRMNGLDTIAAIRRAESKSGKRHLIISMSGNTTQQDEKRHLDAGADVFLEKPLKVDKLYKAIESACATETQAAQEKDYWAPRTMGAQDLAAHLRRTTRGNEKLVRSLVKTFLSDAPKKLSAIRRAIAKKDMEQLTSIAHSLKGSLGIFDAQEAVDAARRLETMGRSHDLQDAEAEFRALEKEFAQLRHELLSLPRKAKSPAHQRTFRKH